MAFSFLNSKKRPPLEKIETVIGSNTSFEGHLKCDGNVRIDGVCEGGIIETVGNVVVAHGAKVAARIIAEHVSVAGEVTGAIYARGRLEILSTGRVSGDVSVMNFYKDETGILSGNLTMGEYTETQDNAFSQNGTYPPVTPEFTEDLEGDVTSLGEEESQSVEVAR